MTKEQAYENFENRIINDREFREHMILLNDIEDLDLLLQREWVYIQKCDNEELRFYSYGED